MELKLRSAGNRNMAVAILVLLVITILALALSWRIYGDNRALMNQLVNNLSLIHI